jgi:hypothetical protein
VLRLLLEKLEALFETVQPGTANIQAYGHKIRETLLLACMEVESSWAAVLNANAYPKGGRLNTNDYVKLKGPMLLDGYELSLQLYPSFPKILPFQGWDASNPTSSLIWYDAYNKTKHDREVNLACATLENVVRAVGAAVVLFHAQFGHLFDVEVNDPRVGIIRSIFNIEVPNPSAYPREVYVPIPRSYVFQDAAKDPWGTWTAINYTKW